MKLLFDFTALNKTRPRDTSKFAMFGLAAASLGHEVVYHDPNQAIRRLDPASDVGSVGKLNVKLPTDPLRKWDGEKPDVYFATDFGCREQGLIEDVWRSDSPTVLIGLRHQTANNEERLLEAVDLLATVKHTIEHPRIMDLQHIVSQGVLDVLIRQGLLDAYLTDNLSKVRAAFFRDGDQQRIAGFVGNSGYGRKERVGRLPPWVEVRWFTDKSASGGFMPPADYLRWLASCRAAVDMPGQHPKTYRFAEAVLLGVPVICCPGLQCAAIPVTTANAIALRFWGDLERLDRLMAELPEIRVNADRCYRQSWSLRAQVRQIIDWVDCPKTRTPAPRVPFGVNKVDEGDLGPQNITYSVISEPHVVAEAKAKYKVLAIIDDFGWAYHNRALAIKRNAPRDWSVTIKSWRDVRWSLAVSQYELIYLLDYSLAESARLAIDDLHSKVPLVVSYNADTNRRQDWWGKVCNHATWVVCVNLDRFLERGRQENCCAISNGVDLLTYNVTVPIADRPDRILWTAAYNASGDKGHGDIIEPLANALRGSGFEMDFRLVGGPDGVKRYTIEEMVAWYNSGAYILCVSESEGTANTITEGVACGCVAVSTHVGNIREWGVSKRNCIITPRAVPPIRRLLGFARAQRLELARKSLDLIREGWGWGTRAPYYFALFDRLIKNSPVKPFIYSGCKPEDI